MGVAKPNINNTTDLSSALQAQRAEWIKLWLFYRAWFAVCVSLRARENSTIWLVSARKLN